MMASPREDANPNGTIPNISLNESVLGMTGEESFIGLQPVTLRASTDSLRRSQVVSNLGLAGEEGFGLRPLRASTNSLRRPGVYTNHAYDNYLTCDDYQPENQYEDLASIVAKQNAPRKKTNDVYESTSRSPAIRHKQNELYESSVTPTTKRRSRNVTECSDDSLSSYRSYIGSSPRQSCLHNLVLFLVLMFSTAAFVLVILQIFGILGMQCGCKSNPAGQKTRTEASTGENTTSEVMVLIKELQLDISRLQLQLDAKYQQQQNKVDEHKNKTANELARVRAMVVNMTSRMPPPDTGSGELDSKLSNLEEDVNQTQHQLKEVNSTQTKYENETRTVVKRIDQEKNKIWHDVAELKNKTKELQRDHKGHAASLSSSVDDLQKNLSQRINSVGVKMGNLSQEISALKKALDKPVKPGSFSTCKYEEHKSSPTSGKSEFSFYNEKKDKKVLGATCSANVDANNRFSYIPSKGYRCDCVPTSSLPTGVTWVCSLFILECSV